MFDEFSNGIDFFKASLFMCCMWAVLAAVVWYYFFGSREHYDEGLFVSLIRYFPAWVIVSAIAIWITISAFPMLNYIADMQQYGSLVGHARELGIFGERPWYGKTGYQMLSLVIITVASYLVHRFSESKEIMRF